MVDAKLGVNSLTLDAEFNVFLFNQSEISITSRDYVATIGETPVFKLAQNLLHAMK